MWVAAQTALNIATTYWMGLTVIGLAAVGIAIAAAAANLFWSLFLFRNEFSDDLPLFFGVKSGAIMRRNFHVTFSAIEDLRSSQAAT